MFDTAKFGALIASLRKSADMTQSELADRLGLTRQAISRYECGDSFPDISVLREMAAIFNTSVELLIRSADPTEGEAEILNAIAADRDMPRVNASDVVSLAPWLKPSILTKLAESMEKCGISISHLVALAEYLNETDTDKLMKSVSFDSLSEMDEGLLNKLLPLLGPYATDTILSKIIDGELDYHYLEMFGGGYEYISLIEAACVYGALDMDALHIMRRHNYNQFRAQKRGIIELFTCPICGALLPHFYPRRCKCGHQVCGDGNILHFIDADAACTLEAPCFDGELLRSFGNKLLILMLGASVDMDALLGYYENGNESCEIVLVDSDLSRLEDLAPRFYNKSFIQIALVHDDPAAPHVADGSFHVIIDNTADKLADGLKRKLAPGGVILRGGKTI